MGITTRPATGSRGAVRIGEETGYGVVVAPTHILDFTTESLAATENVIESEAIREDRGRHKLIRGNLDVGGDISFEQSASGFGLLLRHALGDYVRVPGVDGGVHARMASATIDHADAQDGLEKFIIECAEDTSAIFADADTLVAVVYRDADNVLVYDDNTNAGHAYTEFCGSEMTYITAVTAADTTYTGYGATAAPMIVLAEVLDADGNSVAPDFNASGGVVYLGNDRTRALYFEYDSATREMWLEPGTTAPSVGDAAIGRASFVKTTTTFTIPAAGVKAGAWIMEFNPAWMATTLYGGTGDDADDTVFTHHIERGRVLPIGLTVEVNRDAAIFLYSGCKVNTLTMNFDANAIVTGTVSLIGRQEYSMATLVNDVVPDAASIIISDGTTFPTTAQGGGMITIGEETEIEYTTKVDNADGTTTLSGIVTGVTGIQRFHPKNTNVDSRTTTEAAVTYEGNTAPLTSFESNVYIDGAFEEVMSGSLTLNNNLNGDKFGLGSRFRFQLAEEQAVVEASLTMEFDDGKNYVKFKDGEFFALEFKAISEADDSEIGATGVLSGAYYFLPKCKYTGSTPNIAGTSFIQHDMPVTAIVDDELSTTDLTIILVNALPNDVEAA